MVRSLLEICLSLSCVRHTVCRSVSSWRATMRCNLQLWMYTFPCRRPLYLRELWRSKKDPPLVGVGTWTDTADPTNQITTALSSNYYCIFESLAPFACYCHEPPWKTIATCKIAQASFVGLFPTSMTLLKRLASFKLLVVVAIAKQAANYRYYYY